MNILLVYTIISAILLTTSIIVLVVLGYTYADIYVNDNHAKLMKFLLSYDNNTIHTNTTNRYQNYKFEKYNSSSNTITPTINNITTTLITIPHNNTTSTEYNVFNNIINDNDIITTTINSDESKTYRYNYMNHTFGTNNANSSRGFLWITNKAGIFSQLLQIKIILSIAASSNRTALITPILTEHFNNTKINVCDVFVLPSMPYMKCVDEIQVRDYKLLNCMNGVNASTLLSDDYLVCVKGPLPLLGKYRNAREAVVSAANLPPALKLSHRFDHLIEIVKNKLNIGFMKQYTSYTVVHWRRGDQLHTRCKENKDNSVNCENSTSLIANVRSYTNDSLVYVATNEHPGSKEYLALKEAGFLVFADINMNITSSLDIFMVEVFLMLDATTFLGWGISEVNDVIEHERFAAKKSYCSAIHSKTLGQVTWCDLQTSQTLENFKPNKQSLEKKYKHDTERPIVKRKKEHHHMHSRPSNFSASLNFTSTTSRKFYNITKYNFSVEIDIKSIYTYPIRQNSDSNAPKILWWSASDGDIFTQFLQLKVKAAVANHYGRQLVLLNDVHNTSLCDIFVLPSIISCTDQHAKYYCDHNMNELKSSVLHSDIDNICYNGPAPNFGLDFNYANIFSILLPLDLEFTNKRDSMMRELKQLVGIRDETPFTVVSWDRSKEVLSMCLMMARKDKSMSCRSAEELRVAIGSLSNDTTIYISTNDDPTSNDLARLREAGIKMFRNKLNQPYIKADPLDILILEYNLMIDATTFISWKGSAMISLVEYHRSRLAKSHCVGREKHLVTEFVYCDYNIHELNTTNENSIATTITYSYRVASDVSVQSYLIAMTNDNINDNKNINDIVIKKQKSPQVHQQPQDSKTQPSPNSAFHQQPKTSQDNPGLDVILSKTYDSSQSQGKELYWHNDQDGFFSQFLQLKVKYIVAQKFKRQLVIPPVVSYHFNNVPWSLCDVFVLPTDITCLQAPINRTFSCETVLDISDLQSDKSLCYKGYLPLLGTNLRKESVMLGLSIPIFSFQLNQKYVGYRDIIKQALGISHDMHYTAVHWRRGDQLNTRCKGERDASVNCASNSTELVDLVKNQTNDKIIYLATNEKENSTQSQLLKSSGFTLFSDTNINSTNLLDVFIFEIHLMLDATTFLAWGISEVNDVIEFERKNKNMTFCTAYEESLSYLSFCESERDKVLHNMIRH